MTTLVDSNVLIDIFTDDTTWSTWSRAALANQSDVIINPIIYAEVSIAFDNIDDLDQQLPPALFRREPLPFAAGFIAGKIFQRYRRSGGARSSPLPDFYIGAHAAIAGYALLTRDAKRYRHYFPRLKLLTPSEDRP